MFEKQLVEKEITLGYRLQEIGICDHSNEKYCFFSLTLNKPNSVFPVDLLILCYEVLFEEATPMRAYVVRDPCARE